VQLATPHDSNQNQTGGTVKMNIKETLINNAEKAYSGERGCCCGCLGNYYYADGRIHTSDCKNQAEDDVKRAASNMKRIGNKIFALIDEQDRSMKAKEVIDVSMWDNGVSVTDNRPNNGRTYTLYFS
jgi:hypothetical protein